MVYSPSTEDDLTSGEIFARFHSDDSAATGLRPLLEIEFEAGMTAPAASTRTTMLIAAGLLLLGLRPMQRAAGRR